MASRGNPASPRTLAVVNTRPKADTSRWCRYKAPVPCARASYPEARRAGVSATNRSDCRLGGGGACTCTSARHESRGRRKRTWVVAATRYLGRRRGAALISSMILVSMGSIDDCMSLCPSRSSAATTARVEGQRRCPNARRGSGRVLLGLNEAHGSQPKRRRTVTQQRHFCRPL